MNDINIMAIMLKIAGSILAIVSLVYFIHGKRIEKQTKKYSLNEKEYEEILQYAAQCQKYGFKAAILSLFNLVLAFIAPLV